MRIELIFIPSPGFGHLRSTIELAKQLVGIDDRLSITVIIIPNPPRSDTGDKAYISLLTTDIQDRLRYESISVVDNGNSVPTHVFIEEQKPQVRDAVARIIDDLPPMKARLAGFVLDMFCTSMVDLAEEFHVPTYMVYTSNATFLLNTVGELEPHALRLLSSGGLPQAYPVGPLLHLGNESDNQKQSEILRWLNKQPPESVVFLCFGSMGGFNKEQTREIAVALDRSGHRFLWSLRCASANIFMERPGDYTNLEEVLPEGFLDRTSDRGKVIGWAQQVAVLAHPAVGGFVTHCGWNSILESLWFGVPMATWPLYAEQKVNAFQMVEELGLAVEIRSFIDGDLLAGKMETIGSDDIERAIRRLMESDSDVRKRAKEMAEKCHVALMDGGSSKTALQNFIQVVTENVA